MICKFHLTSDVYHIRSMGGYAGADRCCRQHDLGCSINIEPGVTQYGLTNPRIHTVMHCSCDERFRSCLKMARTQAADIVGNLFFNIADIPCFVFSKEVVRIKIQVFKIKTQIPYLPGLYTKKLVGQMHFRRGENDRCLEETHALLYLICPHYFT